MAHVTQFYVNNNNLILISALILFKIFYQKIFIDEHLFIINCVTRIQFLNFQDEQISHQK